MCSVGIVVLIPVLEVNSYKCLKYGYTGQVPKQKFVLVSNSEGGPVFWPRGEPTRAL